MTTTSWLASELTDSATRRVFEQERLVEVYTNLIAQLMHDQDVSKSELAERLGCSRAHVTQLLNGSRNMTLHTVADLAWAFSRRVEIGLESLDAIDYRPVDVPQPTCRKPRVLEFRQAAEWESEVPEFISGTSSLVEHTMAA